MTHVPVDASRLGFEGDSEERSQHATCPAMAESGSNPEDHILDWGDYAGDHTAEELAIANGEIGDDKIAVYWDSCNSADNDIQIL